MAWDVVSKYNLDMSGATDNAPALAHLASDISALSTANKPLPKLTFSEGILAFSQWPDLAYPHLHMQGEGQCILKHTGTGDAITFNGLLRPGYTTSNITFENFIVAPNPKSANGLTLTSVHVSYIDAKVTGAGTPSGNTHNAAYVLNWCVMTKLNQPQCYVWNAPPDPNPASLDCVGLWIDGCVPAQAGGNSFAGPTTCCTFLDAAFTSLAYGIVVNLGNSNVFLNGACQACKTGIQINDHSGYNKFISFDCEANPTWDFVTTAHAHSNVWVVCSSPFPEKCDIKGWNNHLWTFSPFDGVFGQ